MRIHQLPACVANQIAAGEVIERPASVVKELLENALDAGADSISIDIGCGGLNQIKVSDNGSGIVADDLHLAIAAHATSKIQHVNDLYRITSMGFRGEALASIASVSRLTLSSRSATQTHAMMLRMNETGVNVLPCARNQGTTVDVQDLFFNAPVRKKFLKTERTEFQAIEAVVKRFALCASSIMLALKHNGKPTLTLPPATCNESRLLRIKALLGKDFIDEAVYLDVEHADIRLNGWVSRYVYQRSQRDKQWIYLNRRMVKDKLLHHAIQQAYQDLLHPGRFPACLLYLNMPVSDVDVNVHPTKHEVRFQQPRLVHDFMISSITHALTSESILDCMPMQRSLPLAAHDSMEECISFPESVLTRQAARISDNDLQKIQTQPWHILNSHFAVISLDDKYPYLVNVARAQQHYREWVLAKQTNPLPSRPLLVPVSHAFDKANYPWFEQHQPQLAELGIQFDFMSETRLMVRTIPVCLPTLDVSEFLDHVSGSLLDHAGLLKCAVICQSCDAYQMTVDEKMELTMYLQHHSVLPRYCIRLDIETCLGLMCDG